MTSATLNILLGDLGAVYLGHPENREGGGLEISDKPGQGEGGGLSKTGRPKNKYRNYSIMSNCIHMYLLY